jgi:hypothetical protein
MATGMSYAERRKAPRVDERVSLSIASDAGELAVETRNLSAAGAYCETTQFIAPMTKLQLRFELPDGAKSAKVVCEGVVVRIDPIVSNPHDSRYHLAIFFSDLSESGRAAIARFVQHRLAAGRPPSL